MKINEKIDLLMKITDITNAAMGKILSFDASYISRIRKGKRAFPKDEELVKTLSEFFAQNISTAYQKKVLKNFMGKKIEEASETEKTGEIIYEWLLNDDDVLYAESSGENTKAAAGETVNISRENIEVRFGNSGKRELVEKFLSELAAMDNPPPILLYSNEDFSWMYEDSDFSKRWAFLLMSYLKKGGRIKIIHTISRASGEMLVALQKWIPVYMSGRVEPYYYPKILDRIFRKTIFIAKGYSAITGSSIGDNAENSINYFTKDEDTVNAVENEYNSFLKYCKPLMRIFTVANSDDFLQTLRSFNDDYENMITARTTPSFYTMPETVAKSMHRRLDNAWLLKRQKIAGESFENMMSQGKKLTEVLNLPNPNENMDEGIAFPMCDLYDKPGLRYNKEEFIEHIERVIELLEKHENYNVVISPVIKTDEIVYIKEDSGLILVKTNLPSIAFAIDEQRMVSAFWDFLSDAIERAEPKKNTIEYLKHYVEKIKEK